MFKRIGVVALWVLATVGTASITLAAVGQVGDRVTQQAAIPIDSADLLASPAIAALASTTTTLATTTSEELPTTITEPTEPTTATSGAPGTTATGAPVTTTTSSSSTTSPSTATTAAPVGENFTYDLVGGRVTIRRSGTSVTYVSGFPKGSGWSMEIKDSDPGEVVVEFDSDSHESKFSAKVENGELVVDIEEHNES